MGKNEPRDVKPAGLFQNAARPTGKTQLHDFHEVIAIVLVTVRAGFEFDGATLAPDGRHDPATGLLRMYYPTVIHDALYVFLPDTPFSRREIDRIFRDMMRQAGFRPVWLYFGAVRTLGGVFVRLTR